MKFYQVTLTTGGTAYNLRTLLKAITGYKDGFRQIIIQSQTTGYVHIGGSTVSSTVFAVNLPSVNSSIMLTSAGLGDSCFVLAENSTQKLGITVVY